LKINRPKVLNSLNFKLLRELKKELIKIENNKNIRAVIITGAGERAFVGGADIREMLNMSEKEALNFSQFGNSVFSLIEEMDKVFIAAVNGYALGGGNELLTSCDIKLPPFILVCSKISFIIIKKGFHTSFLISSTKTSRKKF